MRTLHIWDICDNSTYLCKKLNALGHRSKVITRKRMTIRLYRFLLEVIYHLLAFRADVIHINAWQKGVLLARILSPRSKILMHYHGSDIRGKAVPLFVQLCANLICFSTVDLIPLEGEVSFSSRLLPVLIPEMFYYRGGREKGTVLELDQEKRLIEYELMPFVLSLFEFYRDKKRINITSSRVISKTGMEALACGTKVITDTGEIVESFPTIGVKEYLVIYNELFIKSL